MTQFLLLANPDIERIPSWIQVDVVTSDPFISDVGRTVFSSLGAPKKIATITVNGRPFDDVFVTAQRELAEGRAFEGTLLVQLLMSIWPCVDAMALWYGSDFDDLDRVDDIESLLDQVRKGLSEPSAEAYILAVNKEGRDGLAGKGSGVTS